MDASLDETCMRRALELAKRAAAEGEVPVGAVVVQGERIIAEAWNQTIQRHDPSAHAEILALRKAGEKLGNYRLPECSLYITLEPCPMCAGAIGHARLQRVIWAASDPRTGALGGCTQLFDSGAILHRKIRFQSGVLAEEAAALLQAFFRQRR